MSNIFFNKVVPAKEIIVPNSGHWIPEEQPQFLAKILNNFFNGRHQDILEIHIYLEHFN